MRPTFPKLRDWLSACLAVLVIAVSAAPCTGYAAAAAGGPAVSAPADPCHAAKAPVAACVQLACQAMVGPSAVVAGAASPVARVDFAAAIQNYSNRRDPPPDPPPRSQ